MRLRKPDWLPAAYATGAILALAATPACADGLGGVFYPPVGIALTLAIAVLEAPILARIVRGSRPWLVSLAANLVSAAAGFALVAWIVLREMAGASPLWRLSSVAAEALFIAILFGLSVVLEGIVVYLCWRQCGVKRAMLGVLAANAASYTVLVPVMYVGTRW